MLCRDRRFYMNDISCPTENTCYAAAEGFSDGSQPGARIFVTRDGGKTWVNNLVDTAEEASLLRIHAVSETEAWAAGGHVEGSEAYGTFYHTTDGGKTWKLDGRVPYVGETSGLTFVNSKLGYASGINEFQTVRPESHPHGIIRIICVCTRAYMQLLRLTLCVTWS